tara:strand:+ start:568 stop:702 length:135 start_codon:yes stop_codon:yes gene_type:complete
LAAQIHNQTVTVGYGMGIPMETLEGLVIEQSVASAYIEKTVHRA